MKSTSTPEQQNPFLFIGNQLALDFVNTRPVLNGKPTELLPDVPSLLSWFHTAGILNKRDATRLAKEWGVSKALVVVDDFRRFREVLRRDILLWEQGNPIRHSTIELLNSIMAERPMLERVVVRDGRPEVERWFALKQLRDLFAPIAHAAAELFIQADQSRVRKCEVCVLHFLDTSKKGSRRWCSMQFCGNRVKVAAYTERQRRTKPRLHE